jgi:hypothetical protein
MNIQSVNKDIAALEKALALVQKTDNYQHFKKSHHLSFIPKEMPLLRHDATYYGINIPAEFVTE